jgi:YebC/PmpR family DNA-binding regulatory protein
MGRAHEVRAKAMAATAAARSALFMRASKEIYVAAKSGTPDPAENLALRSAIDKWKGQNVTKDVIQRAIEKAKGGTGEAYESGRYEGFAQGGATFIIDTLTDNVNRAFVSVRTVVTKRGGHLGTPGSVSFDYETVGLLEFSGANRDEVEENLVMNDVDVLSVEQDEDLIVVKTSKDAFNDAKKVLEDMGVSEFETAEITLLPNAEVSLSGEDAEKFKNLLDALDEVEDVQAVYHNAKFED